MQSNTEMSVSLEEVREFIESDKFVQFLLNNTTDFGVAAFVLQSIDDKLKEYENGNNGI